MGSKSSELVTVVVAALLIFLFLPVGSVQASSPTAKIINIDYPKRVQPGKTFPVRIDTGYSIQSGVDVGIWDAKSGVMIQSYAIPLPKAGSASFDFKLTAPSVEGDWHLLAITRVWYQDAWYQDPHGGSSDFTINVSNIVTLVLSSTMVASSIEIDGQQHQVAVNKSTSLLLKLGLHTLQAPSLIQTGPLMRFVFVGWSDGINSNSRPIVIIDDAQISAIYRTEYYLSVKSNMGNVSGEGWYEKGSQASFVATASSDVVIWSGLLTDHYRFGGWSGDSISSSTIVPITMDGPKSVEATWFHSGTSVNLVFVSGVFYVGALLFAVRSLYVYSVRRRARLRIPVRLVKRWAKLILPLSTFIIAAFLVPPAYAQLPDQPARSIVRIGDASWYYWKQSASDTCLVWLGGGIAQEGADQYWVNPYEYESFGTIRFLQDLTKYYGVIALEKGSYKYVLADSNRTINQEPYQMQSQIVTQIHDWIRAQGYAHAYLVGYSVGAEVAAMEVSMQSPAQWTSPDGLILITPSLSSDQIQNAYRTRANLLVLYGGNIETPQYIVTGQAFYNGTPAEGWYGSYYQHKEYRIIPKMGHEVWTVLETGAYDTQALHIIISFVEKSKSLQLKPGDAESIVSQARNYTVKGSAANLTTLQAPPSISPDQILIIQANMSYSTQTTMLTRAIAVDTQSGQVKSVEDISVVGEAQRSFNFLLSPPFNSSQVSLEIIILRNEGGAWIPTARPYFTTTNIRNSVAVTMEASVPNVTLRFDGTQYSVSSSIQLETVPGTHVIQSPIMVSLTNLTRAVFTEWEDGTSTSVRQVNLQSNTTLVAYYRKQSYVNATSSYGRVAGSGWYDENSTAAIFLQPPATSEGGVLFVHWTGDSVETSPRVLLFVNSPKTVQARWETVGTTYESTPFDYLTAILPSVIIFMIFLILNLRRTKPQHLN